MRKVFDIIFYGHLWIAGAAMALAWQTTVLLFRDTSLRWEHLVVFLATFSVYTLHRFLSFRRAGVIPESKRYRLVKAYPLSSLIIGIGSGCFALYLLLQEGREMLIPVIIALPFTFFYLIPLWPGGPRLRDFSYLKSVWVGIAWVLMTVVFPAFAYPEVHLFYMTEITVSDLLWSVFLLTSSLAVIFDLRDIKMDRSQGVKTLANVFPSAGKDVAVLALIGASSICWSHYTNLEPPVFLGFLLCIPPYLVASPERSEDYFAVVGNGCLYLPPLITFLFSWI